MLRFEYRDLIGVPFRKLGRDPKVALDCLGLVLTCLDRAGVFLDGRAKGEVAVMTSWPELFEEVPTPNEPGDIVAFANESGGTQHVNILAERGRLLDANEPHGTRLLHVNPRTLAALPHKVYRWKGRSC